jgi:F-type H+-transporting ATPase subunit b
MEMFKVNEFWILVGFVIFFVLLGRTGWRALTGGLDARTAAIRGELDQARTLRAEAQALLDQARARQEQAARDAAEIVESAQEEAETMRREAEAELSRSLAAREAQAMDRIALAEQSAIQSVRARAVDIAIRAATDLVAQTLDGDGAQALIDHAIDELPRRAAA